MILFRCKITLFVCTTHNLLCVLSFLHVRKRKECACLHMRAEGSTFAASMVLPLPNVPTGGQYVRLLVTSVSQSVSEAGRRDISIFHAALLICTNKFQLRPPGRENATDGQPQRERAGTDGGIGREGGSEGASRESCRQGNRAATADGGERASLAGWLACGSTL